MTSYAKDGTVGVWAREKLACLEQYLAAYTTILSKQAFLEGYIYFDAFAGSGRAQLRSQKAKAADGKPLFPEATTSEDEHQYVDGSPRVALGLTNPFTQYIFVDANAERVANLNQLKSEFPKHRIRVEQGDATKAIERLLIENPKVNWKEWRGVVLLDPFGLQVKWSTLEALARTRSLEVLINFPLGHTIQRLLSRREMPNAARQQLLDDYFGNSEWRGIVCGSKRTLFAEEEVVKFEDAGSRLVKWYAGRLKDAFGHSATPRLIKNSRGTPLYFLLFAGPNATGAKIANHVLKQGERIRS